MSFPTFDHLKAHLLKKHNYSFDITDKVNFRCNTCNKGFKKESTRNKHMRKEHGDNETSKKSNKDDSRSDNIYQYSCCAVGIGLLAIAFNSARKNADGVRVMRLYKYLLLLFKLDGKTKYSYYVFQMLQQVNELLPERLAFDIVHNRFTNNKGNINSNVEIDREMEHWNKKVKMDVKDFNGNISERSIDRAAHSYQGVDECLSAYDKFSNVKKPSGRHSTSNHRDDVLSLAEQFNSREIFKNHEDGRYHEAFPTYPKNLFQQIDVMELKDWMISRVKHNRELNVFRQFDRP